MLLAAAVLSACAGNAVRAASAETSGEACAAREAIPVGTDEVAVLMASDAAVTGGLREFSYGDHVHRQPRCPRQFGGMPAARPAQRAARAQALAGRVELDRRPT